MSPEAYCQDKAAQSGSSFYYSFLFLPPERRQGITALYALCREVDDVVDEVQDPGVAQVKLAWWREELARMFEGRPQHPVTRALAPAVERYALPRQLFEELVDGMAMDLQPLLYPDLASLERYCHRVAGVVGLLSARVFGFSEPATLDYAHELGIAFQLTNILRDVGEDARRGRVYLPGDAMAAAGITAAEVLALRDTPALRSVLRSLAGTARARYAHAFALLPDADRRAQRPGLIMATIYRTLLDEIGAEDYAVMHQRIALTPLRKLWLAWLTWIGWRR
ncbi:MAG: presqualene diphosphate synthase HpnD [Pseudomonadota bacterium]|nr:presqualene diphosphate synthase HpnD [Pseudomonadota bacterium]